MFYIFLRPQIICKSNGVSASPPPPSMLLFLRFPRLPSLGHFCLEFVQLGNALPHVWVPNDERLPGQKTWPIFELMFTLAFPFPRWVQTASAIQPLKSFLDIYKNNFAFILTINCQWLRISSILTNILAIFAKFVKDIWNFDTNRKNTCDFAVIAFNILSVVKGLKQPYSVFRVPNFRLRQTVISSGGQQRRPESDARPQRPNLKTRKIKINVRNIQVRQNVQIYCIIITNLPTFFRRSNKKFEKVFVWNHIRLNHLQAHFCVQTLKN